jgi:hypothetical protein
VTHASALPLPSHFHRLRAARAPSTAEIALRRLILCLVLLCMAPAGWAVAPYMLGTKLPPADLAAQMTDVEKKLQAEGFSVIGRHMPKGLAGYGTVVVTDAAVLEVLRAIGGSAVVAAGIRIGVQGDGTVSYMNPDYWYRAYLRGQFDAAQTAVQSVQTRLARALGTGAGFGGDVASADLPNYRYMVGMERFDSTRSELHAHASFQDALKTVRANLASGVGGTARVYEVVLPEREVAVFGVAMDDVSTGEAWWVNKIGADHMAGLPYEVFIVGNKVYALYARYRIALGWPSLGMGQFMGIINAPSAIQATLGRVAGVPTAAN